MLETHNLVESISVKGSYFAEVEVVGKQGVISFQWSSFIFFYYLFVPAFVFFPLSSLHLHQCHFTRMRKTKKGTKEYKSICNSYNFPFSTNFHFSKQCSPHLNKPY